MTMDHFYRDVVESKLNDMPADEVIPGTNLTPGQILQDSKYIDRIWYEYQKMVEEYDCDPDPAFDEALKEAIGAGYQDLTSKNPTTEEVIGAGYRDLTSKNPTADVHVGIKGMEMPKNCAGCRLKYENKYDSLLTCPFTHKTITGGARDKGCPLVELSH